MTCPGEERRKEQRMRRKIEYEHLNGYISWNQRLKPKKYPTHQAREQSQDQTGWVETSGSIHETRQVDPHC